MRTNAAALALIERYEGFVDHWYPDPGHGWAIPTCCYGHTDAAGEPKYAATKSKTFTKDEAAEILARDLAGVEADVSRLVKVELNENQFGALVSFTFNLGARNLETSTLLKRVNAGKFSAAADEFGKWVHANGKKLDGLVARRAAEAALFSKPVVGTPTPPDTAAASRTIGDVLAAILKAIVSLFARKE